MSDSTPRMVRRAGAPEPEPAKTTEESGPSVAELMKAVAELTKTVAALQNAQTTEKPTEPYTGPRLSGKIRPLDLRDYNGPLFVTNNTSTIISHDDEGMVLRIEPKHSDVGSIQMLPPKVAQHPGFQRLWRQGKVAVSTDPEMEDKLALAEMRLSDKERLAQETRMAVFFEESEQDKSVAQVKCLECGGTTFQKTADQKSGLPPLCSDDQDKSYLYTVETYHDGTGVKHKWIKPTVDSHVLIGAKE